ncbi:hypothetical protein GNP82_16670 [Aliivibrio fischeri]|uniref:hypothetical protein n=1 Tax=Aliivibrio fischeri TaxID=668 RepID=UPI0012D860DA|nr:hypothetical protein [Aliivibrio fischeri]MUK39187.1 hypothetical protein [Aliivibrio fischeri]MUL04113.1 hypothetical protein [Aliivibrio fischeri]MUL06661.1 hypothetical protein [Aliivibrio fischeri]
MEFGVTSIVSKLSENTFSSNLVDINKTVDIEKISTTDVLDFQKMITNSTLEKSLQASALIKCASSIEQLMKGQ